MKRYDKKEESALVAELTERIDKNEIPVKRNVKVLGYQYQQQATQDFNKIRIELSEGDDLVYDVRCISNDKPFKTLEIMTQFQR